MFIPRPSLLGRLYLLGVRLFVGTVFLITHWCVAFRRFADLLVGARSEPQAGLRADVRVRDRVCSGCSPARDRGCAIIGAGTCVFASTTGEMMNGFWWTDP